MQASAYASALEALEPYSFDILAYDGEDVEGISTTATGAHAHAEGNATLASGNNAHAEGYLSKATGFHAHSEGRSCVASGQRSHAEGDATEASANDAHAEGSETVASGQQSHAEGYLCEATNFHAHAEGRGCIASGQNAHAEGRGCVASGEDSHAEGAYCEANGTRCHASGFFTTANLQTQFVIGVANVISTDAQDKFIIGRGVVSNNIVTSRSNCFRVNTSGTYGVGAWNSSGADYAELFEWQDGNLDSEDRVGLFVTLDGDRIRIAGPEDDYILGIVSAAPSVVGDVYDDQWARMFMTDIFGRPLWEDVESPDQTDQDGNILIPAHLERRQKINPDYDHTMSYQPRTHRPEWDAVGLLGKLVAVDDGTCQVNGWATVGPGGVATASTERTKYRIMARLDAAHVRVMIL